MAIIAFLKLSHADNLNTHVLRRCTYSYVYVVAQTRLSLQFTIVVILCSTYIQRLWWKSIKKALTDASFFKHPDRKTWRHYCLDREQNLTSFNNKSVFFKWNLNTCQQKHRHNAHIQEKYWNFLNKDRQEWQIVLDQHFN